MKFLPRRYSRYQESLAVTIWSVVFPRMHVSGSAGFFLRTKDKYVRFVRGAWLPEFRNAIKGCPNEWRSGHGMRRYLVRGIVQLREWTRICSSTATNRRPKELWTLCFYLSDSPARGSRRISSLLTFNFSVWKRTPFASASRQRATRFAK